MCNNSFIVTSAYVCLLLAVLACALSYVAPFWIRYDPYLVEKVPLLFGGSVKWADGLWANCAHDKETARCSWYWESDFYLEKRVPGRFSTARKCYRQCGRSRRTDISHARRLFSVWPINFQYHSQAAATGYSCVGCVNRPIIGV